MSTDESRLRALAENLAYADSWDDETNDDRRSFFECLAKIARLRTANAALLAAIERLVEAAGDDAGVYREAEDAARKAITDATGETK